MRALLLLAVLVLLALVVASLARALAGLRASPPARRGDQLVKDPVCQTYIVMSRAVRSESGGAPVYFCSRECAARFARREGWRNDEPPRLEGRGR
jgi:YHS domain-containing protein